jgi:hypothetical protein
MKKILFLSCIVAALSAVPVFCITGLTPLTGFTGSTSLSNLAGIEGFSGVAGLSGITGKTDAPVLLSVDGTILAEGGSTDGDSDSASPAHNYDIGHLNYLCTRIHESIAAIGTMLLAEQTGLLTDAALKDVETFNFYKDINGRAIQNAKDGLTYYILCLRFLDIPCVQEEGPVSNGFDVFGDPFMSRELEMSYDVIFARYAVKEKYEAFKQWFVSLEAFIGFLVSADCDSPVNKALAAFMKNQLVLDAQRMIDDFEKNV